MFFFLRHPIKNRDKRRVVCSEKFNGRILIRDLTKFISLSLSFPRLREILYWLIFYVRNWINIYSPFFLVKIKLKSWETRCFISSILPLCRHIRCETPNRFSYRPIFAKYHVYSRRVSDIASRIPSIFFVPTLETTRWVNWLCYCVVEKKEREKKGLDGRV